MIFPVDLKSEGCMIYFEKYSVIGDSACLLRSLNLALQNGMKMEIKNKKLF